jgi:hypothetical protein
LYGRGGVGRGFLAGSSWFPRWSNSARPFLTACPFACSQTPTALGHKPEPVRLVFSAAGPDEPTKARIAEAFWSILLEAPDDLRSFSYRHAEDAQDGTYVLKGGFEDGVFYDDDEYLAAEDDDFLFGFSGHEGLVLGGRLPCEECGGTGEESFFPAGGDCRACDGSGRQGGL